MLNQFDLKLDSLYKELENSLGTEFVKRVSEFFPHRGVKNFSEIPVMELMSFFNSLNISLDSVMSGKIDIEALLSQFHGGKSLARKYKEGFETSSRFATIYMLDFIGHKFGESTKKVVMKHFQLLPDHLEDHREWNNFLLSYEIAKYVETFYGGAVVKEMGASSLLHSCNSVMLKTLMDIPDCFKRVSFFFESIAPKQVEKNYFWKIHGLTNDGFLIEGKPNPEVLGQFSIDLIASDAMTNLRAGFLETLINLNCERPYFEVNRVKSVLDGSSIDVFLISPYNSSAMLS